MRVELVLELVADAADVLLLLAVEVVADLEPDGVCRP
jgi:hypothetical protein